MGKEAEFRLSLRMSAKHTTVWINIGVSIFALIRNERDQEGLSN